MKQWQKVFIACMLGAFIGSIVALQLNGYLWWIGLLAGGLVGYVSYDFKVVTQAVPVAWTKASGWRPDTEWWRFFSLGWLYTFVFLSSIFVPLCILLGPVMASESGNQTIQGALKYTGILFLGVGFTVPFVGAFDEASKRNLKSLKGTRNTAMKWNVITFFFWHVPLFLLKKSWWLVRRGIPSAAVVIARFSWHLFKLIHSDERLLCGIDSAIGVLIGYFTGNAIIGALLGGMFGVLNFEIMSKRVLKVVPMHSS